MKLTIYGNTSVGRQRDHNEDSYLIIHESDSNWVDVNNQETDLCISRGLTCVVADGMGGANAGEVASEIAVTTVREVFGKLASVPESSREIQKLLSSIILEAHNRIIKSSRRTSGMEGMGTTIVIGCFFKDTLYVSWSGDSRCYVYNKNYSKELQPFTDDHSLVWERVKSNEISPEEARLSDDSNLILQSLGGVSQKPVPEFRWIKLHNEDRILFCSDGLNSMLSNVGIQQILDFNPSPQEACEALIRAANNAGGRDNITSIVIDVSDNKELIPEVEKHETIPSSVRQNKNAKRKRPFFLLSLIFLSLIIISGILFRSEVSRAFRSLFRENHASAVKDLDQVSDTGKLNNEEMEISSVPEIRTVNKSVNPATKKSQTINKDINSIDSAYIETRLSATIDKIAFIKNNVEWYKPGGKIGSTPEFYNQVKAGLDSILVIVARQEDIIKAVATLTKENKLARITDYGMAQDLFMQVGDTINDLEKKIRVILEDTLSDSEKKVSDTVNNK
jgi:serine/threonine protein phosphatase PrpC